MELPLDVKKEDLEEEEEGTDVEKSKNGDDEEKTQCATSDKKQEEAPQTVEPKQDSVLNLNNEVVKMRKEVKRVRALIIRKLTRQIANLKKKKGKDSELERNQRRAARVLEEIHAIKDLVPDLVTKTALQKKLNFEKVCKNPKSSISDRAIARIASHPQFSKRIEAIKSAVKAFKDERSMELKHSGKLRKRGDELNEPQQKRGLEKEKDVAVGPILSKDNNKIDMSEVCQNRSFSSPKEKVDKKVQKKEMPRTENKSQKLIVVKSSDVKAFVKTEEESEFEGKSTSKLPAEVLPKSVVEAESDLESSEDDEKEYFDDSTEERFHKQSSAESDSDNDFFLGKVSKFKKKKKNKSVEEEKVKETPEVEGDSNLLKKDKVQSELDELESRLKSKATSMKSVFCSSLAGRKQDKGAVKGHSNFGERGKQNSNAGGNTGFSKHSTFQFKGNAKDSGSKYIKPCQGDMALIKEEKGFISIGRGRGQLSRQKDARGRSMFSHQGSQQPLHPSWEASKKRKEQQGQILAFQGKKIKFNDDD